MTYVAFLRGINVGGNNKVDMKQLAACFEAAGMQAVKTYINSGNVIFIDDKRLPKEIVSALEATIEKAFGFSVKVLLRDLPQMKTTVKALPATWTNDSDMKCDVMFLWEAIDTPEVLKQTIYKSELEKVIYTPGAILWSIDRKNVSRGGMLKLVGTDLYKQMTIRNCNTARKLLELMKQASA